MDEQALSAIRNLLDRQPTAANVTGALVAAIVSGDPEVTVVARSGFPPPFASDSRVLLYSFSKTIVAAALLRLVAAGRLSLHDTLGRFLPQHPLTAKITLRAALAHTSGLPDYGGLAEYHAAVRSSSPPWSREEFLARTGADRLLFEPGSSFAYSNIGYMWLRDVLTRASDGDMATVLRREIFDPLGVTTASVPETKSDLADFTFGPSRYLANGGTPMDVIARYDPGWIATGVVGSSATDATRILRGIMTTLLPPPLRDEMMTAVTRFAATEPGRPWRQPAYGLGLQIDCDESSGPIYGHTGGGPGVSPAVFHFPRRDPPLTLAVITDGEDIGLAETLLLAAAERWQAN